MYEICLIQPKASEGDANTPLWCRAELMYAASELSDLEPKLASVYKGKELVAQMPLYEKKYLGFTSLASPTASYYQGLHFYHPKDQSPARNALDELRISNELALFLKRHYKKFCITLSPSNCDVRGFSWNKLKLQPLYTYIHDYSSELQPLSEERRKLRHAAKEGYSFEQRSDAAAFIQLIKAMYTRKNHHPFKNIDSLKMYIYALEKAGLLKQYNVLKEGIIVSSNILLQAQEKVAYSILRASVKEEMDRGVSLWHTQMLIKSMQSSCGILDFCGANTPDVARFKAAMGLQLKLFFRLRN